VFQSVLQGEGPLIDAGGSRQVQAEKQSSSILVGATLRVKN